MRAKKPRKPPPKAQGRLPIQVAGERPSIDMETQGGRQALRRYVWLLSERLRGAIAAIVLRSDDGRERLIALLGRKRSR